MIYLIQVLMGNTIKDHALFISKECTKEHLSYNLKQHFVQNENLESFACMHGIYNKLLSALVMARHEKRRGRADTVRGSFDGLRKYRA